LKPGSIDRVFQGVHVKVLESVSFFSRGQKVLRFKFSALFCQLSLKKLGRQQRLILLVEKDQQVLQMGKTITINLASS
jgi:hypothetical protein